VVALSELHGTRDEGVLGAAVDEGAALEDRGHRVNGGGSNLLVVVLDGSEEIVSRVVDAINEASEALSVGRPEDHDLVELVGRLELPI